LNYFEILRLIEWQIFFGTEHLNVLHGLPIRRTIYCCNCWEAKNKSI